MLIYDFLKKDHEIVKQLLEQLQESSPTAIKRRRDLLQRLHDEIIPHIRAEEKVFYEPLKDIAGMEDMVLECYEEHVTTESILRELESMDPSQDRWDAKLTVFKESFEHHVDEEEQELFNNARQVLAAEEAQMMGEAFKKLKVEVKEGSILQSTLEKVAQFMPARFSQRFTDLARRL